MPKRDVLLSLFVYHAYFVFVSGSLFLQTNQRPDCTDVVSSTPVESYYQSLERGMDRLTSISSSLSPRISVVPNELLFNHKMPSSISTSSTSSQAVSIINHTRRKIWYQCLAFLYDFFSRTCFNCNPASYGFYCIFFYSSVVWTVAQDSPFSVSLPSCELAPLKSTSVRVTYDPKQLNTLHGAQLECFAYYKVIVEEKILKKPHHNKQLSLDFFK